MQQYRRKGYISDHIVIYHNNDEHWNECLNKVLERPQDNMVSIHNSTVYFTLNCWEQTLIEENNQQWTIRKNPK